MDTHTRAAAFHEAGHAVVAIATGGHAPTVTLKDTQLMWPRHVTAIDRTIAIFAGTVAAKMFTPVGDTMSREDWSIAFDQIGFQANLRTQAARDQLTWRAENLVREHRDAIRRVAEALMERGKLTDSQVRALMRGESLRDDRDPPTYRMSERERKHRAALRNAPANREQLARAASGRTGTCRACGSTTRPRGSQAAPAMYCDSCAYGSAA